MNARFLEDALSAKTVVKTGLRARFSLGFYHLAHHPAQWLRWRFCKQPSSPRSGSRVSPTLPYGRRFLYSIVGTELQPAIQILYAIEGGGAVNLSDSTTPPRPDASKRSIRLPA